MNFYNKYVYSSNDFGYVFLNIGLTFHTKEIKAQSFVKQKIKANDK